MESSSAWSATTSCVTITFTWNSVL
jgi:hypothetical protein